MGEIDFEEEEREKNGEREMELNLGQKFDDEGEINFYFKMKKLVNYTNTHIKYVVY